MMHKCMMLNGGRIAHIRPLFNKIVICNINNGISIQNEIDAVKFLLGSFRLYPNEEDRQQALTREAARNEKVYIFADFSRDKLQDYLLIIAKKSTGKRLLLITAHVCAFYFYVMFTQI